MPRCYEPPSTVNHSSQSQRTRDPASLISRSQLISHCRRTAWLLMGQPLHMESRFRYFFLCHPVPNPKLKQFQFQQPPKFACLAFRVVDEKTVQCIDTTLRGRFLPWHRIPKAEQNGKCALLQTPGFQSPRHKLGISCSVFLPSASNLEITKASLFGVGLFLELLSQKTRQSDGTCSQVFDCSEASRRKFEASLATRLAG